MTKHSKHTVFIWLVYDTKVTFTNRFNLGRCIFQIFLILNCIEPQTCRTPSKLFSVRKNSLESQVRRIDIQDYNLILSNIQEV